MTDDALEHEVVDSISGRGVSGLEGGTGIKGLMYWIELLMANCL